MKADYVSKLILFSSLTIALLFSCAKAQRDDGQKKEQPVVVTAGKTVKVRYALKVDGKVVDSSEGREPLEFKAGAGQLITGFERAVMGMKIGEKKSFRVGPDDGYGPEDPGAIQKVPRSSFPKDLKLEPGMVLNATGKSGKPIPVRVVELKDDVVVVDFNHPLAGKTLDFDVEVVDIK